MKVNIGPYSSDLVTFRNVERKYEAYRAKKLGIPFFDYEPVTKVDKAVENTANFLHHLFLQTFFLSFHTYFLFLLLKNNTRNLSYL